MAASTVAQRRQRLCAHLQQCATAVVDDETWDIKLLNHDHLSLVAQVLKQPPDQFLEGRLRAAHIFMIGAFKPGGARPWAVVEMQWTATEPQVEGVWVLTSSGWPGVRAVLATWRSQHRPGHMRVAGPCVSKRPTFWSELGFYPDESARDGTWTE